MNAKGQGGFADRNAILSIPPLSRGKGGIGGLLARTTYGQELPGAPATAFYHADCNANVRALVYPNQQLAAKYLYDPFGNMLAMSGPLMNFNKYRFSSKEWNENSGLYYYGRRFYNPSLQRWLNRDPSAEAGGMNLYCSFENDPIDAADPLGLSCCCECAENINIDDITFTGKGRDYGHMFNVNILMDYSPSSSNNRGDATLQWWEWTTAVSPREQGEGVTANWWYNLSLPDYEPEYHETDEYVWWKLRDKSCGSKMAKRKVVIDDWPNIPNIQSRILRWDIIIVNPPHCNCKLPGVRVTAIQNLDKPSGRHDFITPDESSYIPGPTVPYGPPAP